MVENPIIQELIRSQFFHLLSILVCIGVMVWVFVKYYHVQNKESDSDVKLRVVNTFYISGILLFIIIELVTAICMGNSHHADILSFVSFASTISSLVMSVVAIIFTIVYHNSGEGHYLKLDATSDKVQGALTVFETKASDLDKSVDRFQSVSDDLAEKMGSIMDEIRDLKDKTDKLHNKTDKLLENDHASQEGGKEANKVDDKVVSRFVEAGSFSGNLALYACALARETGRHFSVKEIAYSEKDSVYQFGYLIASASLGIVNGRLNFKESCTITDVYPRLKELLIKALKDYIEKRRPKEKKEKAQARLDTVESLFLKDSSPDDSDSSAA